MRYGKIASAVHDRCVKNVLRAAGMEASREILPGSSVRSLGGRLDPSPEMVVTEALGRLMAGSVSDPDRRVCISVQMLLTPETPEEQLKSRMKRILSFCGANGLELAAADAAVCDALSRDILAVTASWKETEPSPLRGELPDGADLYMAGYTGLAGTGIVCRAEEEKLLSRFPAVMVEKGKTFLEEGSIPVMPGGGCLAAWPVSEGGILAALWEMGEYWEVGLDVDLRAVPVRQETIEICDHLQIHPYQLFTCGAVLFTAPRESAPLTQLRMSGGHSVPVALIGKVTSSRARILHSGEEVRYLDKPAQDSLFVLRDEE